MTPECVWQVDATLGEGPLWLPAEKALWFVDIRKNHLHRYEPETGAKKTFDTPENPGFIVCRDGEFIVGMTSGLYRFRPANCSFTLIERVDADKPGNRINDGALDARGRLWFGTMDNGEEKKTGSVYRYDERGLKMMDGNICITNGPCFSPDCRTFYHTDTLEKTVWAYDVTDDGQLSNKRLFVTIEDGAGYPDGSAIDAEGCLWLGLFAGWAARRYSPQGKLVSTVRFPCANITKLCFAGPDLKTVYATTAWKGLSEKERAEQPLAGGLFRFESTVAGL